MRRIPLLLVFAGVIVLRLPAAEPKPEVVADEKLLTDANLKHDGASLVEFLKKRTGKDDDFDKVAKLIPKLGDETFANRWKAFDELRDTKPPEAVAGSLRRLGLSHSDEEVRDQSRVLLRRIEKNAPPRLAAAAVRLLRERKPDGQLAVLLAYLPFAQDEHVEDEVLTSLTLLGIKDGKMDAGIAPALKDALAARRGLAALLLGRSGSADEKKAVAALLEDKDNLVRLRAAQGLVAGRDKDAVPTLIALLVDGTLEQATQAEDLLACLAAGRSGPRVPLGDTNASRKKCQEAWAAWWKATDGKLDLAKAEVDLSPFNSTLRMRETIRQFLLAINRTDVNTASSLIEVPFQIPGQQVFTTRDESDNYWSSMIVSARQQNMTLGAGSLVTLDEYLRTAPPIEKEPLGKLKKSEYRVLYVNTYLNGQYAPNNAMWRAFLLHIDGPQVRICAVGQGMR